MPYAANGIVSQSPIEGGITISQDQYISAIEGMLNGLIVSITNGFELVLPEEEIEEEVPEVQEPIPEREDSVGEAEEEQQEEEITLEQAKSLKMYEIDAARDLDLDSGFFFDGHFFDSDIKSVQRINAIGTLVLMQPDYVSPYITQANEVINLDAEKIVGLGMALAEHVAAHIFQARALKDAVLNASSFEEVEAIKWTPVVIEDAEDPEDPENEEGLE